MFKNYFLIAIRNIQRNSFYSFINIAGLSIGIASSILILLWVADEISFDRFHTNYDRLYKVYMNQQFADGTRSQTALPYPLKEAIKNKSSQVKHAVITNWGEGNVLSVGENRFNKMGLSAGEDFLKMFSFHIQKGDVTSALADPYSIVLTTSTARALFGDNEAIGQMVKFENDKELKVTAIIEDLPRNSTFSFDFILPFSFYEIINSYVRGARDSWKENSFQLYVEVQPEATEADVNASIQDIVKENNKDAKTAQVFLHPMSKWRLYSFFTNGKVTGGMIEYVRLFGGIGIFVLLIACINFMNLATARSESRAREVGIRKSVGSRRKELIYQFLGESMLITFLAFLFALILVELALPAYNVLVDKKLFIDFSNPLLWLVAFAMVVLTGAIAGSYPAFYLSAFQPAQVLKGKVKPGKGASTPRKVLVTMQFGFSIFLIIGTIVIYQQIQHVKSRDVGYDRENLMIVWSNAEIEHAYQTIKEELKRTGVVRSVSKSNSPVTRIFSSNTVEWPDMEPGRRMDFTTIATEYDYTETLGIKMLEGRDFSRDFKSDSSAMVINASALKVMGLQNPIGTKLKMWGQEFTVIGVMEDVIMGSPYQPIDPLVMIFSPNWSSAVNVRLEKTKNLSESISRVESVFKKLNPTNPMWYFFADAEFDSKFATINLVSRLAGIFASLAILITCLGLFGLAAFTAEQRQKEVGIRKVLGASISGLVFMISKDFSRLVIFAFVISAPIAWWLTNGFLDRYPYRIEIPWWVLPTVGAGSLVLAVIIVSTQAVRAATVNPVESLKNE